MVVMVPSDETTRSMPSVDIETALGSRKQSTRRLLNKRSSRNITQQKAVDLSMFYKTANSRLVTYFEQSLDLFAKLCVGGNMRTWDVVSRFVPKKLLKLVLGLGTRYEDIPDRVKSLFWSVASVVYLHRPLHPSTILGVRTPVRDCSQLDTANKQGKAGCPGKPDDFVAEDRDFLNTIKACGWGWCGVVWCGAMWIGVEWSGVEWNGVEWSGVEWSGVEWSGVEWSGVEWSGVEWSGVEWSGVEWSGVEWSGVEWSGVEWSGVEWSGVEWSGLDWTEEAWSGARVLCRVVWCSGVE